MIAAALADSGAALRARVIWLASTTADSMATTDGAQSLYTAALLQVLRARDPATYEEAQAAVGEALAAHDQPVPGIHYRGPGNGSFSGPPFRP